MIKVLGIHFSYNKKLETEENYQTCSENRKRTEVMENPKFGSYTFP